MKRASWFLLIVLSAACSTVDSRIRRHQDAFDASSPEVQEKIRAGQVEVGFTQEQATMALGRPDRVSTRKTAIATQEVWAYGIDPVGPRVGLGFGMAYGGPGFLGMGTAIEGVSAGGEARLRVIFENGVAVSIESRKR